MSVAFRRDSDEEHKEPKFEIPLPAGPNLVTARGLALIEARVAELEGAIAAEPEDEAREALKRELRYWNTRRTTAEIAPPPEDGVVGIGSRVRVRLAGKERAIDVVGHDEADPHADRLAFSAPLAQALLGAEAGERVDFNGRPEAIEIVEVSAIPD
ncbi:transcription elongation GreA/GreB family factor [Sphingomonas naasensis]|uniref:Nucleoside-diphosphate kinase n=1 Tax=Sphingomonas naasensis TaxID=1344951 RepID=A0A4S1W4Y3_9SPHN|nr:GreA/GreB family elongation factor [Sphingomonas naasensis]NIJ19965.1 transcription elongation GreA/GreB family factor [Sphingomonas naasensis]TGX37921.1 nucleoside-diphosphate kinase [Sphingomonas naasensis]